MKSVAPTPSPSSLPKAGPEAQGRGARSSALPALGDVVCGKYRIEEVVGEGGMGMVYAAHHLLLDHRIALKVLLIDHVNGPEIAERFVREAQAAARLHSEHLVRVTDAGTLETGAPFLVMEFLQGRDLAEVLRSGGPLPASDVADYALQALAALAKAHAAGIVHRDVKPANLFLSVRDDGSSVLKVLDFGISKQASRNHQWKELTGKAVLGTPFYMSPEQLRSSKTVDSRADIWSVGVVLYELLCGRLPFDGDGPGEVFSAILEKSPEALRVHRPDVPEAWSDVIAKCLERTADARFQNAAELARSLAPLGSGRWTHLLQQIDGSLAVAPKSLPDTALVEAANAAARASLCPPPPPAPRSAPRYTSRSMVAAGATDKTLFADVVSTRIEASPRRRVSMGTVRAVAVAVVVALVGFAANRAASRGPVRPVAAASPPVLEVAPVASMSAMDPPAVETAVAPRVVHGDPEPAPPAPSPPRRSQTAPKASKPAPASQTAPSAKPSSPPPRSRFLHSWPAPVPAR